MRPATIRRLIVFGVCALGVAALYLVPTVTGGPAQLAEPQSEQEAQPVRPIGYATQRSADQRDRDGHPDRPSTDTASTTITTIRSTDPQQTAATRTHPRDGGSANRTGETPDREPPSTVTGLSFPTMSSARLTIRWAQATDNVAVAGYRVWLNGFRVADTTQLQVAVAWFNDGSRQQVVQVRAVDLAGNQSTDAPAQLVERPLPSPTPPAVDDARSTVAGVDGRPAAFAHADR